jgi:hypothetical protein
MSKFRVGQRVRIKWDWNPSWPNCEGRDMTGAEATVIETFEEDAVWEVWPEDKDVQCYVLHIDGKELPEDGYHREDQLEPATDSYDVIRWDQCVWQPEHLRVDA